MKCVNCTIPVRWYMGLDCLIIGRRGFDSSCRDLGAVHRKRPQSGGFIQCGQGGFFRCGRSHFLVQKNSEFCEIYGVSAVEGSLSADEGGSIFRGFVRTSFIDGPKT